MDCFSTYFTYFTHFTYVLQTGVGWGGGVGWGAMTRTVPAHIFDATQLYLRTCSMLRNCTCSHVGCYAFALAHMFKLRNCTCAHVRCYAIVLAHMFDATQSDLRTCSMLRNCTWAHVRCYAIALGHMFDATQLHLRTCWMLRNCICTHPLDRIHQNIWLTVFELFGHARGHGVLNSCVWTRICPSSSSWNT